MNKKIQLNESDLRNIVKKIIKEEVSGTSESQELADIDRADDEIRKHFHSFMDAIGSMSELLEEVDFYNEPFLKLYSALEEFEDYYINNFTIDEVEAHINGDEY